MRANNKENTVLPPSNLNAIHTKIIKILTFTITFAIKNDTDGTKTVHAFKSWLKLLWKHDNSLECLVCCQDWGGSRLKTLERTCMQELGGYKLSCTGGTATAASMIVVNQSPTHQVPESKKIHFRAPAIATERTVRIRSYGYKIIIYNIS